MRTHPIILAVVSAKGGVGKSLLALLLSVFAALEGHHVEVLDLDGNPGLTGMFCHFRDELSGRRGLQARLRRDPENLTIMRLLLHPERGLEGDARCGIPGIGLEYPLRQVLTELLSIRQRYAVSCIDGASLTQRTLEAYQIDLDRLGSLTIVPNSGSFESFVHQVEQWHHANPAFQPHQILATALREQERTQVEERGERGMDLIVLDTAGERGIMPNMAYRAATHILLPIEVSQLSVAGAVNSIFDIEEARSRRPDGDRYPVILPVVVNKFRPEPQEGLREYVESEIVPQLREAGATVNRRFIPYSYDIDQRASRRGILPFEYNPLDEAVVAVHNLWIDLHNYFMAA